MSSQSASVTYGFRAHMGHMAWNTLLVAVWLPLALLTDSILKHSPYIGTRYQDIFVSGLLCWTTSSAQLHLLMTLIGMFPEGTFPRARLRLFLSMHYVLIGVVAPIVLIAFPQYDLLGHPAGVMTFFVLTNVATATFVGVLFGFPTKAAQ